MNPNEEKPFDYGEHREASADLKYKLAETTFKTVLDADIHIDNKASRIVGAMAFLTAAAAAIYGRAYSSGPTAQDLAIVSAILSRYIDPDRVNFVTYAITQGLRPPRVSLLNLDLSLYSFTLYVLLVVVGTVLYLAALGPVLNIPSWFKGSSDEIKSLLFFDHIGNYREQAWREHWSQSAPRRIQDKVTTDLTQEAFLIAQKARQKWQYMSIGSLCFRAALAFLIVLIGTLLPPRPSEVEGFACFGWMFLAFAFSFEMKLRSNKNARKWSIAWLIAATLLLIRAATLFFRPDSTLLILTS